MEALQPKNKRKRKRLELISSETAAARAEEKLRYRSLKLMEQELLEKLELETSKEELAGKTHDVLPDSKQYQLSASGSKLGSVWMAPALSSVLKDYQFKGD